MLYYRIEGPIPDSPFRPIDIDLHDSCATKLWDSATWDVWKYLLFCFL